jgi:hypothetical protein
VLFEALRGTPFLRVLHVGGVARSVSALSLFVTVSLAPSIASHRLCALPAVPHHSYATVNADNPLGDASAVTLGESLAANCGLRVLFATGVNCLSRSTPLTSVHTSPLLSPKTMGGCCCCCCCCCCGGGGGGGCGCGGIVGCDFRPAGIACIASSLAANTTLVELYLGSE